MAVTFERATKRQARLRLALIGPSGSGKTYTALAVASALAPQGKIALVDTERGSASKYAHKWTFDVLELSTFEPEKYIEAIHAAEAAGYDVLILDSLSHAWVGKGGILEFVDTETAKTKTQSAFTSGWRKATPKHNALVDAMIGCGCHLIGTMRTKTAYVLDQAEGGKVVPRKVGLQPVQRDGLEYEFDLVGDLDLDNRLVISKSRCEELSGLVIEKPGAQLAAALTAWLTDGAPEQAKASAATVQAPERPYAPQALKERIAALIPTCKVEPPAEGYAGLLAGALDFCFAPAPQHDCQQNRHTVQKWLFGKDSLNELSPQELRALGKWLAPKTDEGGAVTVSETVAEEARRVLRQALLDQGQAELFPEPQDVGHVTA